MAQLTDTQIARYAGGAGFTGPDLATAVAVCLAESGGRTDDRGDVALETATWGPSIGLMQIRSLKAERGTGGTRDELANLDPATNMVHAHQIFAANGWHPWSTYNSGAYLLYLGRAKVAVANAEIAGIAGSVGGGGGGDPSGSASPDGSTLVDFKTGLAGFPDPLDLLTIPGDLAGTTGTIAAGMVKAAHWLSDRNNWLRIGYVTVGALAVVAGLYVVARPIVQPVVDQAAQIGKQAATVAAVA